MSIPHNFTLIGAIMNAVAGVPTPSIVSITGPTAVNENAGGTFTVNTTNFPDGNTTLNWTINYIGGSSAADFSATSGNVTISSSGGTGSGTLTVTASFDGVAEPGEAFTVTVSGTVGGKSLTRTSSSVTITDVAATSIPAGTFTGRISDNGIVAIATTETQEAGGPAVASATSVLEMVHGSQDGGSFVIRVYRGAGDNAGSLWYNTSGASASLPTLAQATPPTIYYNSVTPTAFRLETSTNGGPFVDGGWVAVPTVGSSTDTVSVSTAVANSGTGRVTDSDSVIVRCYGRADGYLDTLLATFEIASFAGAESDF